MKITIGDYLINRLKELGIKHIIGLPGDFNLQFLEQINKAEEGIEFSGACNKFKCGLCCRRLWKRTRDSGSLCNLRCRRFRSYCRGCRLYAAEHVPVIVITGAPPLCKKTQFQSASQLRGWRFFNITKTYEEFTAVQTTITQQNAEEEIDEALRAAIRYKRPVNIKIPSESFLLLYQCEK